MTDNQAHSYLDNSLVTNDYRDTDRLNSFKIYYLQLQSSLDILEDMFLQIAMRCNLEL